MITVTLVVDAYEVRDVAIFDFPGEYLNADMPEEKDVRIKLEGKLMDIMCDVNPDHIPNIWYKHGKKVLYLRIIKSLCGFIESNLL